MCAEWLLEHFYEDSNTGESALDARRHLPDDQCDGLGEGATCKSVKYKTVARPSINFAHICKYLKNKEISCQKYNYSLDRTL